MRERLVTRWFIKHAGEITDGPFKSLAVAKNELFLLRHSNRYYIRPETYAIPVETNDRKINGWLRVRYELKEEWVRSSSAHASCL